LKVIVTGCCGFIGSNLTDRLLLEGYNVVGIDNLSTGQNKFIEKAITNPDFQFIEGDLLNLDGLKEWFKGAELVFHLSANADIRDGLSHPFKDLEQNTIVTFNVLESMRFNNIKKIVFSSTGSVYGDSKVIPTPENAPFPIQTSLYATSKVAGEGMIQSYCEGYGFQSWIFRFVSILGERYSHGHVYDFYHQLIKDPNNLRVLGDGNQRKSYLYVGDCVDAILHSLKNANDKVNIFNLGTDEYVKVKDSIKYICRFLKLDPKLSFTGGERGWVGDNPFIFLDCSKIKSLGWKPKLTIEEGVVKTISYLKDNNWLFNNRN
jgi:UDP-glucose 4-epimerase